MEKTKQIDLGKFVGDQITKVKGTIVTRSHHLDGTRTYCVQSQEIHNGKPADSFWVSECRLKIIDDPENRSIGFSECELDSDEHRGS